MAQPLVIDFEVTDDNKTNFRLVESPDNDYTGVPSKPGEMYLRNPGMDILTEGGKPAKHIRATLEVID